MAHILLVDDDHDVRELGAALLKHAGHEVTCADSAIGAIQNLRQTDFDILITDANMPNLSGFDLLKMIKLDDRFGKLSIVMLTARNTKEDVAAAIGAGAHDFIVKPIDANVFIEKIAQIASRKPIEDSEDFVTKRVFAKARATTSIDVRMISELGVTVRSNFPFKPGTVIHVECDLFAQIGIESQDFRVFVCQEKEGFWETRLSFVEMNDYMKTRIRDWLMRKDSVARRRPRTA